MGLPSLPSPQDCLRAETQLSNLSVRARGARAIQLAAQDWQKGHRSILWYRIRFRITRVVYTVIYEVQDVDEKRVRKFRLEKIYSSKHGKRRSRASAKSHHSVNLAEERNNALRTGPRENVAGHGGLSTRVLLVTVRAEVFLLSIYKK